MKIYKQVRYNRSTMNVTNESKGYTIEERIERILNQNEPIKDVTEQIFTERKDGILPEYNPRTDRWDIAIEATDKISKDNLAKRQEAMQTMAENSKKGDKNTSQTEAQSGENSPREQSTSKND